MFLLEGSSIRESLLESLYLRPQLNKYKLEETYEFGAAELCHKNFLVNKLFGCNIHSQSKSDFHFRKISEVKVIGKYLRCFSFAIKSEDGLASNKLDQKLDSKSSRFQEVLDIDWKRDPNFFQMARIF